MGKYDISKSKFKILGNYTYKEEGNSFISAAIVEGQSTPAPYQAIDLNKIKDRVFSLKISKSGMNAPKKIEKNFRGPQLSILYMLMSKIVFFCIINTNKRYVFF